MLRRSGALSGGLNGPDGFGLGLGVFDGFGHGVQPTLEALEPEKGTSTISIDVARQRGANATFAAALAGVHHSIGRRKSATNSSSP
jgi:hypothetical protein